MNDGNRHGLTLLEVLAAVTIMGVLALVLLPRMTSNASSSKIKACNVIKGNIEVQSQLWFRNKGTWPAADLSDIAADTDYLPDGLQACPVDGTAYAFDSASESVTGHNH